MYMLWKNRAALEQKDVDSNVSGQDGRMLEALGCENAQTHYPTATHPVRVCSQNENVGAQGIVR